jgi:hypothetical protein
MQLGHKLFFVLFLAFLSMPKVLTLIEKDTYASMLYNVSEEEECHK